MTTNTERRHNQLEDFDRLEKKIDTVEEAVLKLTMSLSPDHPGQHEYIKKAMEREARKEALHRAIIEKTVVALVWSAIVGLGSLLYSTFISHWH